MGFKPPASDTKQVGSAETREAFTFAFPVSGLSPSFY